MALGGNATFASQLLNSSAAQIWKGAALRACAPLGSNPHFRHVNISFSCGADTIIPAFFRTRGSADSCGTDRQEAAQRNRCTVMVAPGMGARSLRRGPQAGCTDAARWCTTRVWMWPGPTPRIAIVHGLHAFSRHSKHSPKTEAQPKPMFTQPSSKLQQSQTRRKGSDSTNNRDPKQLGCEDQFQCFS